MCTIVILLSVNKKVISELYILYIEDPDTVHIEKIRGAWE